MRGPRVGGIGGEANAAGRDTHLVYALQTWTQPSVHAEYPPVHDSTEREVVEDLATPSPHVAAPVFSLALIIEAIHLRDLSGLMVTADKGHAFRIADFEGKEKQERFNAVEPAIDKVACGATLSNKDASDARRTYP